MNYTCDGYLGKKTWVINYSFPGGINSSSGQAYHGDARTCFIPDVQEGREVLTLLVKAFRRRLNFALGYSVVRNEDNCVVWAIHHKTNTHGGTSGYGFPDPTYFNRVS